MRGSTLGVVRTSWRSALALTLAGLLVAAPAQAGPEDPDVVAGSATITQEAGVTVVEAADRTIIDWRGGVDVGVGEELHFLQPHELAIVLNRDTSLDPTHIDGLVTANGRVYLLNPYGVYFGDTAIVDVGGLIAAGGDLSNADFLAGSERFTGLAGAVENRGTIEAGSVGLFGASVANHGRISAPDGAIWLMAGDEIVVAEHGSPVVVRVAVPPSAAEGEVPDRYAVDNTGTLAAERGAVRMAAGDLLSLAVRNQGVVRAAEIALEAGVEGRVQVEGTLDASSAHGDGGEIDVRGDLIALEGATLDASGATGGGRVHVGGGWRGARDDDQINARLTWLDAASSVRADALESGEGGEVVIWSDRDAIVHGAVSARGGDAGGDGGRIETSGKQWIDLRSTPDVSAPRGRAGLWLLDPSNIRVVTADVIDDLGIVPPQDLSDEVRESTVVTLNRIAPIVDDSFVDVEAIAEALGKGATVFLSTQNETGNNDQLGNISFEAVLDLNDPAIQAGTSSLLLLRAANDVTSDVGFSDVGSNLSLSLTFVGGDPDQPAAPSASADDSRMVRIGGDIDVGGSVGLFGDRIEVLGDIAANRSQADSVAGSQATFGIALQANEDGIATRSLTTEAGSISLISANSDISADVDIDVSGDIVAPAGGVEIRATGGDIRVGAIQVCEDCTLPTVPGSPPSPAIDIAAIPIAEGAAGSEVYLEGSVELRGGDLASTLPGVAIRGGSGNVQVIARSIDVQGTIDTAGGDVLIGTQRLDETPAAADGVVFGAAAAVTTDGGAVVIGGAGDMTIGAGIDARATTTDAQGTVDIAGSEAVAIDGVAILADERVSIQAGSSGSGDLVFAGGQPIVEAGIVELGAGDAYTVDAAEDDPHARIDFGNLEIRGPSGALAELEILQDATIGAGELPDAANVQLDTDTDVRIASLDGAFVVDADAAALLNPVGTARIEAARRPAVGGSEALDVTSPLSVGELAVTIAEDFTVDAGFATNVSGVGALDVTTGTQARPASDENEEVLGGLAVEADLTGTGGAGFTDLRLHAGAAGLGDLTIGNGVTPTALSATSLELRAGDGVLGAAAEAAVVLQSFNLSAEDFTLRQDAAIGGEGATTIPDVPNATRYALRSDDAGITIVESDRAKLENRALALAANSLSTSELVAGPLAVTRLDVGGIGNFTVSDSVLDAFQLGGGLTVRAGIGLNGILTVAPGTLLEGETIRLVASDGPGGNTGSAISGATGAGVRYQKPGSVEAPDRFVMEQDAVLVQSAVPFADQFGAEDSGALPNTLGLRGFAGLDLSDLTTLPVATGPLGTLVLGGNDIAVRNDSGITFASRTEFRGGSISLLALGEGASIDPNGQDISYAAHATAEGEADGGDFLPDIGGEATGVPEVVVVQQSASLTGANLASDPFEASDPTNGRLGTAETKTRYQIESITGTVSLDEGDANAIDLTNLTLAANGDNGGIDLSTPADTPFTLESLTIRQDRGLTLASSFEVDASQAIVIQVGTEDSYDPDAAPGSEISSDLVFAPGTVLHGNRVILSAGDISGFALSDRPAAALAGIDAAGVTVELRGEDARAGFTQDASIEASGLPTIVAVTDPDPTIDTSVDFVDLHSRRGDLTIGTATAGAPGDYKAEDYLDVGRNVLLRAGSVPHQVEEGEDFGGTLTLELEGAQPLAEALPAVEILEIAGRNVLLSAAPGGKVLARSDPDRTPTDFTLQFTTPDASSASLESAAFEQDGGFEVGNASGTIASEIVQANQFVNVDRTAVEYVLRSRTNGDFVVDPVLANQLAIFDVTLETAGGAVTIQAETPPPGGSDDPDLSPVFTGFTARAPTIEIATPRFDTILPQTYEGATTLTAPETTLGSFFDVVFDGTVDGAASLTVQSGRVVQFTGDVGGTQPLRDLTVQFAGQSGVLEFGSVEDTVDSTTQSLVSVESAGGVGGTLAVESIDPVDYLNGRMVTVLEERSPAPSVASIRKRGGGTLLVDADEVRIGAGQKWTAVGTLQIGADGDPVSEVTVGDLAAQRVEIWADALTAVRRAGSSVERSDGAISSDAGVDWVANEFDLFVTGGLDNVFVTGSGNQPVVGTPSGERITVTDPDAVAGTPPETVPFSSAAIYPNGRNVTGADLLFQPEDGSAPTVLDLRPTGPPATDFSRVLTEFSPAPSTEAPWKGRPAGDLDFRDVGIVARAPTGRESAGREQGAGILDDASTAWRRRGDIALVASPRLDPERAAEASARFRDLFGPDMENAESIRLALGRAVSDYRDHTGVRRVLGFELRRFLRNRPSTQFEAYQLLEQLDRLFSAHRSSGLVPGEYEPIQRRWVEAITPTGIDPAELAQAIHPSRYVRGSDVLDVFGD